MGTRSETLIPFLNEQPLENITGAKCPTNGQVFCHFWYLRNIQKKGVPEAMQEAVTAAKVPWHEAGVVTKVDRWAIDDLKKLFEKFKVG